MIPHGDMFISFPAAHTIRVKTDDPDRMCTERNKAKQPKPIGRGAADSPNVADFTNRFKGCIRLRNILQGLQLLKPAENSLLGHRKYGCFLNDQFCSPCSSLAHDLPTQSSSSFCNAVRSSSHSFGCCLSDRKPSFQSQEPLVVMLVGAKYFFMSIAAPISLPVDPFRDRSILLWVIEYAHQGRYGSCGILLQSLSSP